MCEQARLQVAFPLVCCLQLPQMGRRRILCVLHQHTRVTQQRRRGVTFRLLHLVHMTLHTPAGTGHAPHQRPALCTSGPDQARGRTTVRQVLCGGGATCSC